MCICVMRLRYYSQTKSAKHTIETWYILRRFTHWLIDLIENYTTTLVIILPHPPPMQVYNLIHRQYIVNDDDPLRRVCAFLYLIISVYHLYEGGRGGLRVHRMDGRFIYTKPRTKLNVEMRYGWGERSELPNTNILHAIERDNWMQCDGCIVGVVDVWFIESVPKVFTFTLYCYYSNRKSRMQT